MTLKKIKKHKAARISDNHLNSIENIAIDDAVRGKYNFELTLVELFALIGEVREHRASKAGKKRE